MKSPRVKGTNDVQQVVCGFSIIAAVSDSTGGDEREETDNGWGGDEKCSGDPKVGSIGEMRRNETARVLGLIEVPPSRVFPKCFFSDLSRFALFLRRNTETGGLEKRQKPSPCRAQHREEKSWERVDTWTEASSSCRKVENGIFPREFNVHAGDFVTGPGTSGRSDLSFTDRSIGNAASSGAPIFARDEIIIPRTKDPGDFGEIPNHT